MEDKSNIATEHFMKWIKYTGRLQRLMRVTSVNDIKLMLLELWKKEKPSESFIKGAKLIKFESVYGWVCDERGYELPTYEIARHLLSTIKNK